MQTISSQVGSPGGEAGIQPLKQHWTLTGPRTEYPQQCLHERVEMHARNRPEKLAVIFEHEDGRVTQLSYSRFAHLVNVVAYDLRKRGVGVGDLVGVCLDLSLEGILSFLALNKIGAAPYFLDPQMPPERLSFLLTSADVRLFLTQEEFSTSLFSSHSLQEDTQRVLLERMSLLHIDSIEYEHSHALQVAVPFDAIAYAIATSGTTGDPKGVPISHRALANYIAALSSLYALAPGDRILEAFSLHFDAAIGEIALAFFVGATLCFSTRRMLSSGPAILAFLKRHEINHSAFTPSMLAELPPDPLPALRSIECGGQRCSRALVEQWAPGRRFVNVYGPTETTIGSTYAECVAGEEGEVPIGRPFPNVWVGILDNQQRPVPQGEIGEIVIGGVGVSPGYLNRHELSSRQFITVDGALCYRTGDRGLIQQGKVWYRERVEGDLEVKLSGGRRFNLGELETKLLELPAILSCAVGMWDNRLVAYLVARVSSPRPGIPEIQAHLSRWIPAYAIPTFYQWVAGLPLNSNGKIARNLLPAPDWQSLLTEGEWVAPSTQTEEVLVQILKENLAFLSLSLEPTSSKIDVSRTFGQLGLDSLSATNYILSAQPHFTHIIHLDEGRLLRLTPIQLGHMLDNQEI